MSNRIEIFTRTVFGLEIEDFYDINSEKYCRRITTLLKAYYNYLISQNLVQPTGQMIIDETIIDIFHIDYLESELFNMENHSLYFFVKHQQNYLTPKEVYKGILSIKEISSGFIQLPSWIEEIISSNSYII